MQIEDSKMKLSIIIPVFRSEATLDRCLRSIIDQPLAGMEVVLVDDGSPDGCPQICDEYAALCSFIVVLIIASL
jgi:glycosyltransferase involved in cell wall biosynthesis